jgi:23S rRNA pseudouridine1911/1915/1917 synthase
MAIRTFLSDRGDTGRRLDLVLRRHLANLESATRNRVQTWIETGTVSINGQTVRRVAARVAPGDVLTVDIPDGATAPRRTIAAEPTTLDILFEDDHLIVLNKRAGIVVHPSHAQSNGTLLNALAWYARDWGRGARPSIVGRLDKLTSGIVLVAKTAALHRELQAVMGRKTTTKEYLAIVYGHVTRERGKIDLRLRRDATDRRRMVASIDDGAPSLTEFERLAQVPAPRAGIALLRCRLLTGRTHQIRAHLAARGWPIVGDPMYGQACWSRIKDDALGEMLRVFPRQALHAWRLAFHHPVTMAMVNIEAPVPDDMRALMDGCRIVAARYLGTRPPTSARAPGG